jgi:hypothetical protein
MKTRVIWGRLISSLILISCHCSYADYESSEVRFMTKHGELLFLNEHGQPDVSAVDVKLNGKTIISSRGRRDAEDYPQALMLPDMIIPYHYTPKSKPTDRPVRIDRVIVEEGPRGNCARRFIIMDFTMEKPYVSERFGDNPNNAFCYMIDKIEWGKKETYIYLSGPEKYVYYTGGKVIGPVE